MLALSVLVFYIFGSVLLGNGFELYNVTPKELSHEERQKDDSNVEITIMLCRLLYNNDLLCLVKPFQASSLISLIPLCTLNDSTGIP